MATYRQRSGTGRGKPWTAQVYAANGKRAVQTFPTKALAVAWATKMEARRLGGEDIAPEADALTLGALWVPFIGLREGQMAPSTVDHNRGTWTRHLEADWASVRVRTVRRVHVETWAVRKSQEGVGVPTLKAAVTVLQAMLSYAVETEVIAATPLANVKLPKYHAARRAFVTVEEVEKVLAVIPDEWDALLVELMARTGLRIGEALGLRKMDLDVPNSQVYVNQIKTRKGYRDGGKTEGSARWVHVPRSLMERMNARPMLPLSPVFVGDDRSMNDRVLAPACKAAGVERFTNHALRHHAASVWVGQNMPLFEVARHLGHTTTTQVDTTYAHLVPGSQDRLRASWGETDQAAGTDVETAP